jgi:hypothetical protein
LELGLGLKLELELGILSMKNAKLEVQELTLTLSLTLTLGRSSVLRDASHSGVSWTDLEIYLKILCVGDMISGEAVFEIWNQDSGAKG